MKLYGIRSPAMRFRVPIHPSLDSNGKLPVTRAGCSFTLSVPLQSHHRRLIRGRGAMGWTLSGCWYSSSLSAYGLWSASTWIGTDEFFTMTCGAEWTREPGRILSVRIRTGRSSLKLPSIL